jgi:glycosyltransferase involved in cell wall biosynthesis
MILNVLWFAPVSPYPVTSGAHLRHLCLLRAAGRAHNVTLVCPAPADAQTATAQIREMGVEVRFVPNLAQQPGRVLRAVGKLRGAVTGRPAHAYLPAALPAMTRLAEELGKAKPIDVAFGQLNTAPAVFATGARVRVLDEHNVEEEVYRRLTQCERLGPRKLAFFLDWRAVAGFERAWLPRADLVTACSDRDRDLLRQMVRRPPPIEVVLNGVDTEAVTFQEAGREPETLVMVGGMSYAPNVDAAEFLVRDVMPRDWASRPGVRLLVVGSNPVPQVRALAGPRVEVTGTVPDVRPYLHRAAATVVPLRSGGGTRFKILEAMAAGTPVVSTELGAEGLGLRDGEEVRLARTADELAGAILAVLADPAGARRMAAAARRRVERDYSWQGIGAEFVRLLERLTMPCPASAVTC